MLEQPESNENHTFKVGPWVFAPRLKELKAASGKVVRLEEKISLVLETLCKHDGAVVSKEELIHEVWEGREVSEQTVPVAISKLRKLLGDSSADPTMLETIPRKGYRLMVPPTEATMAEALHESSGMSGLSRMALAFSLLAIILVGWSFYTSEDGIVTTPAGAAKPGIILTINDVRAPAQAPGQMQRAIALSELASFYLSQVPDVLVIRHWWNLDAPDPTGGIYTRYGENTPVYSIQATLIENEGVEAVTVQLSNPKTDEVIWSGLHPVNAGTGYFFGVLRSMLQKLGVVGDEQIGSMLASSPVYEDERYWVGRYFTHLSNARAAKTAEQALEAIAVDQPNDPVVASAQEALAARWNVEFNVVSSGEAGADIGYLGIVDRAAVALFQEKDAERAVILLETALEVAPGDHYALSLLAEARLAQGDKDGGIEAYRKAIRLAPFARSYGDRLASLEIASED